jgi:beta-xylosidase/type 1 glutamine amidotransferase
MNRFLANTIFIFGLGMILPTMVTVGQSKKPIPVLIVDGFSNHDWKQTSTVTKWILEKSGRFKVDISTVPIDSVEQLNWKPAFEKYAVVIQNTNNIQNTRLHWPAWAERNLEQYVKAGGGLYVLHSGNNAFPHWEEYNKMIGLGWRPPSMGYALEIDTAKNIIRHPPGEGSNTGHGARFNAVIQILNRHPINKNYPDQWQTANTEVYNFPRGPAENLTVLSYAYDSTSTHRLWPVEWVVTYGKGRVYNSSMGHLWKGETYPPAYRCIGFQTTMIRATEWLATGNVTYPVPENFPTKDSSSLSNEAPETQAHNPVIFADVPDMSMVRVGNSYYMSSTTMHMSPGVPIMRSDDLVNWELINYAYDTLANVDELNLENGKSTYGKGSWASSIRYHNSTFYVSTFAQTTGKTYIFSTKDIEKGPWKTASFKPAYHDHSLFFDDDGRVYMIYGGGKLRLIELNGDVSAVKEGSTEQVIIENASAPSGANIGLPAEGSQLFKVNGKYYLINITWPRGGMRTVVIHKADNITGPYEGRVALQDLGVAQGGLIDLPNGAWYAYLFRDFGAVGRIPYWVPVKWEDGWPVLGVAGKVPDTLQLPASKGLIPGIVASDEFSRKKGEPALPLVWQWNHNPDNTLWSVTKRKGYLRLTTGRIDTSFLLAKNTLTQRTIGPVCTGTVSLDVTNMKEGDFAGLSLLQKNYGLVGVKANSNGKSIVMINAGSGQPVEVQSVPLTTKTVYCKVECNFTNRKDTAHFYYSLDGKSWTKIGSPLKMSYTIPHFMGYRFGLFNYATKKIGGYADFDFFHIDDGIIKTE